MTGTIKPNLLLLAAVLVAGCGRALPPAEPVAKTQDVRTEPPVKLGLAVRLAALTDPQQRTLTRLLVDSLTADERPPGDDEYLADIGRELRRLTLSEADELGIRLDTHHGGAGAEFALFPVQHQQRALERVRQIQERLTGPPTPNDDTNWIAVPISTAERDLKWLRHKLGSKVVEVTGLSFAREHHDFGPGPTDVADDEMKVVAAFTGLERLDLRLSQVGDAGLAHLAGLQLLEYLDLGETKVTDEGLRHLTGLSQLAELRLQRTNIVGPGLAHLAECVSLATLKIEVLPSQSSDMRSLNHLESLEELSVERVGELDLHDLPNLVNMRGSLAGLSGKKRVFRLVNMPALEVVQVGGHDAPTFRFEFGNLPEILRLSIYADIRAVPFEQIGELTNVRELTITADGVEKRLADADVSHLAKLRQLTRLWLGGKLDSESVRHFENLTALRSLAFGGRDLDDAELSRLNKLKLLQELTIHQIHGSGRGFDVLQQLPQLRSLSLSRAELDSLRIADHPTLRHFRADECRIGDLHVTGLPNLQWLGLRSLKTETVTIGDLPKIGWLDLSLVRADVIKRIALHGMPRLNTLQLMPIAADGSIENLPSIAILGDELLSDIATFPNLEMLNIRYSAITDAGLKQLAPLRKLRSIEITGPNVTPEAVRQLQKAR